jgi:hypothetical protein
MFPMCGFQIFLENFRCYSGGINYYRYDHTFYVPHTLYFYMIIVITITIIIISSSISYYSMALNFYIFYLCEVHYYGLLKG